MERAPPVSFQRGREYFPYPSRPVPPPRTSAFPGPQSRSYADVVRQGDQGPARRFVSPRAEGSDQIKRIPADPQFGHLTRKLYSLIKMVHHLQNVAPKDGKQPPRMIAKMTESLSTMIRPASPTAKTLEMIKGNAENWGYNTLLILKDHYEDGLQTLLEEISGLLVRDWKEPFQVAVRWIKRNLPHVSQEVIDYAEALVTARGDGDDQPRARATNLARGQQQTTVTVATMTEGTSLRADQVSQSAQVESSQEQDPQPPQVEPPQDQDSQVLLLDPSSDEDEQPPLMEPPWRRRQDGDRRYKGMVYKEDLFLDMVEEREESSPNPETPEKCNRRSIYEDLEDLFGSPPMRDTVEGPSVAPKGVQVSSKQGTTGPRQEVVQVQIHREDIVQQSLEVPSPPRQQLQRVTRHINSERKMIDWGLSVRKKWLIIGDSNLSRMPTYDIPDLQIDSYPGASFRHAEALMKKSTSVVTVEKVILSFGLNHRGQKARETAIKQLQAAVRAAKKRFPYAEIWVPLLNFSSALARDERQTLKIINGHIEKNMPFLSALDDEDFDTEMDNVHWTRRTAVAVLKHWAAQLNLITL